MFRKHVESKPHPIEIFSRAVEKAISEARQAHVNAYQLADCLQRAEQAVRVQIAVTSAMA
jgi:hypothetical protein